MRPNHFILALFAIFLCLAAQPAKAAMAFCNRTEHTVQAAFGYREQIEWISEGWWQIEAGQCLRIFNRPLTQRFYFYYAMSLAPHAKGKKPVSWEGKYQLCIDTKAFHIEGDEDCEQRGYKKQGFQQVDIGANTRDYTLEFKETDEAR